MRDTARSCRRPVRSQLLVSWEDSGQGDLEEEQQEGLSLDLSLLSDCL